MPVMNPLLAYWVVSPGVRVEPVDDSNALYSMSYVLLSFPKTAEVNKQHNS